MNRRFFLALCLTLPGLTHAAEEVQLTAAEIKELLNDKTIRGQWYSSLYTQTFDNRGYTTYTAEGMRPDTGNWRVNTETNRYESFWNRSGWSSYPVYRKGDRFFWGDGDKRWWFKVNADN